MTITTKPRRVLQVRQQPVAASPAPPTAQGVQDQARDLYDCVMDRISAAEFEAGAPGQDSTQPDPESVARSISQTADGIQA